MNNLMEAEKVPVKMRAKDLARKEKRKIRIQIGDQVLMICPQKSTISWK
jgi:hypothetical protein